MKKDGVDCILIDLHFRTEFLIFFLTGSNCTCVYENNVGSDVYKVSQRKMLF